MIKLNEDINSVKNSIKELKEKQVIATVNVGRNKFSSFLGRVENVYSALFTLTPEDDWKGKTTYSYSEYMCGKIKLKKISG